ncbi:peroxiredoxin [Pseudopelagicola sp. nBUS_20]|uniref:peroxiredoxin n=1 Tax=Pseudopelagicola sp. nBUS_20 TaxID=3395317 RepID=UPI003EC1544B
MTIAIGDTLPKGTFSTLDDNGPETIDATSIFKGRKVVLFGLPGAFTGQCSTSHVPSFMRTADAFREKGIDEIVCLSVNDPFVMSAWDKATGAGEKGVTMLADPAGDFTQAIGMAFTAPAVGFINRSKRYSALIEDGVVKLLNLEENAGGCSISEGETLLEQI